MEYLLDLNTPVVLLEPEDLLSLNPLRLLNFAMFHYFC